MTKNALSAETS